jgi:DNA-binding XRE family transcriptional regulator
MKGETSWTRYAARKLRNPRFRAAADAQLAVLRVGVDIAKLRERRGLTQTQLAAMLGTTASAISRIENGSNITLKMLTRIAQTLRARAEVRLRPVA